MLLVIFIRERVIPTTRIVLAAADMLLLNHWSTAKIVQVDEYSFPPISRSLIPNRFVPSGSVFYLRHTDVLNYRFNSLLACCRYLLM